MGMETTQQTPTADLDGAVKIGNVVHLLGTLMLAAGLLGFIATVATTGSFGLALLTLAGAVVSGFVLMALGAITKVLAHIAGQRSNSVAS